jgi:hypothetical protein
MMRLSIRRPVRHRTIAEIAIGVPSLHTRRHRDARIAHIGAARRRSHCRTTLRRNDARNAMPMALPCPWRCHAHGIAMPMALPWAGKGMPSGPTDGAGRTCIGHRVLWARRAHLLQPGASPRAWRYRAPGSANRGRQCGRASALRSRIGIAFTHRHCIHASALRSRPDTSVALRHRARAPVLRPRSGTALTPLHRPPSPPNHAALRRHPYTTAGAHNVTISASTQILPAPMS